MLSGEEFIALVKDAAKEGQFYRFSAEELEYVYSKGVSLLDNVPHDKELLEALFQLEDEIMARNNCVKVAISHEKPTEEPVIENKPKRTFGSIVFGILFFILIVGFITDCSKRTFRAFDGFFYDIDRYDH